MSILSIIKATLFALVLLSIGIITTEQKAHATSDIPTLRSSNGQQIPVDPIKQIEAIKTNRPTTIDEFEFDQGHWSIGSDAKGAAFYSRGAFYMSEPITNVTRFSYSDYRVADFLLEVNTTHVAGPLNNSFGVMFRLVNNHDFYGFFISSNGYFQVIKQIHDQIDSSVPWTRSIAIHPGRANSNKLSVLAIGDQFTFLVNNIVVAKVKDTALSKGQLALAVGAMEEEGVIIAFDDFKLWAIEADTISEQFLLNPAVVTPTISSASIPTPAVMPESFPVHATVNTILLNLRKGPGTNFGTVGKLRRNEKLTVIGQINNCTWLKVLTPQDTEGWVAGGSRYVALSTTSCANIPEVMALPLAAAEPSSTSSSADTSGQVVGIIASDAPIAVILIPEDEHGRFVVDLAKDVIQVDTDDAGHFVFDNVPSGVYLLVSPDTTSTIRVYQPPSDSTLIEDHIAFGQLWVFKVRKGQTINLGRLRYLAGVDPFEPDSPIIMSR